MSQSKREHKRETKIQEAPEVGKCLCWDWIAGLTQLYPSPRHFLTSWQRPCQGVCPFPSRYIFGTSEGSQWKLSRVSQSLVWHLLSVFLSQNTCCRSGSDKELKEHSSKEGLASQKNFWNYYNRSLGLQLCILFIQKFGEKPTSIHYP